MPIHDEFPHCLEKYTVSLRVSFKIFFAHLRDGYEVWYSVQQDPVSVVPAELWESEADDVQNQMQQVVDGQGAHQQVEVAHHLLLRRNRKLYVDVSLKVQTDEKAVEAAEHTRTARRTTSSYCTIVPRGIP